MHRNSEFPKQDSSNQDSTTMKASVKWTGAAPQGELGMTFQASTGSGHAFVMDGAPEGGGNNLGPRPMETVLAGTGACTAYDVVLILRKSGQDVRGCEVALDSSRAETEPKVFTAIHFHFTVRGVNLRPTVVEHAIKLSHEKYCSASIMLGKTAAITRSTVIVDDATGAVISDSRAT
jgi:putative redox protein